MSDENVPMGKHVAMVVKVKILNTAIWKHDHILGMQTILSFFNCYEIKMHRNRTEKVPQIM